MAVTDMAIVTYTAVKQEGFLRKSSVSLIITHCRNKVAECLEQGKDINRKIPWVYEVARLDKDPDFITGVPCCHCHIWVNIGDRCYRKRSSNYTRIYCIPCADRLGLRHR